MRTSARRLVPLAVLIFAIGWAASCGDTAHNDFQQTLEFAGFFSDAGCSTGMFGMFIDLSFGPVQQFASWKVKNRTTGIWIPGGTGGTTVGMPVPVTRGVRIFIKNVHIEYRLPVGFLPPRDIVTSTIVAPGAEQCVNTDIVWAEDLNNMIQDPLSYPPTPFIMNTRVTIQGITEGGLNIEVSGDLHIHVT